MGSGPTSMRTRAVDFAELRLAALKLRHYIFMQPQE
jgi:hypothetical protein